MRNSIRLIGPTAMMFIGLQIFENVPITFLLFYSWLIGLPLIDKAFPKKRLRITKQAVLAGAVSGLVFFLFIFFGMNYMHVYFLDIEKLRVLLIDWGFAGPAEFFLAFIFLTVNPFLEEVYWRGYMYEKLRANGKAAYAIWMTSIFYALYHLITVLQLFSGGYSFLAVLPVLIAGLIWAYLRERTGTITATIIGHVLADLGIMCVYWFIVN